MQIYNKLIQVDSLLDVHNLHIRKFLISNVSTHYTAVIISDKRGVTKTWVKYRDMTGDWVIIGKQVGNNWEYNNSGGTTRSGMER